MFKTVEEALEAIDRATEPKVMSKSEALEFLETLRARIDSSIEALREELSEEDEG